MQNRPKNRRAFTLIELLTVVAIIAALVGILSVAQRKVKIVSKNLRQKAVFHDMEIGLELFSHDFNGYPLSNVLPNATAGANLVCGAQHLTEALVGRDMRGFDPKTDWYAPDDSSDNTDPTNPYTDHNKSIKRRKPLYVEVKQFGVNRLDEFYENGTGAVFSQNGDLQAPVFTDVFLRNRLLNDSGKVGSPILYYKADSEKKYWQFRKPDSKTPSQSDYEGWVYNYDDNKAVIDLGFAMPDLSTDPDKHFDDLKSEGLDQAGAFYRFITDDTQQKRFFSPYNANGFILISAGYDGVYGTRDDLTNFNY